MSRTLLTVILFLVITAGCGGVQKQEINIQTRMLEENKAFEIINEVVAERGLQIQRDVDVELANKVRFKCDYRFANETIAIEYLSEQDRLDIGEVPPPAPGSRLHVIRGRAIVSDDPKAPKESIYIYLIDDRKYEYQHNPTSEVRANVTFLEVDSRLRLDLKDFLSWYEGQKTE